MERFPCIMLLFLVLMTVGMCLFFGYFSSPYQSIDVKNPSLSAPAAEPPIDVRKSRVEVINILNGIGKAGTFGDRLRAARALYSLGEEVDIYTLSCDAIENGTVLDRLRVLEDVMSDKSITETERPLIVGLLQDNAYVIRERSISHLSQGATPSFSEESYFRPYVKRAIDDPDYYVRAAAARVLGKSQDMSAIPDLLKRIDLETGWTRLSFAQALALLSNEKGISILESTALNPSDDKLGTYALGMRLENGEASVLPALINRLRLKDDRVREIAGKYLSRFAPEEDCAVFVEILSMGDFHSMRALLSRMKTFEKERRELIFAGALHSSNDRRREILKIFGNGDLDMPLLINAINDGRFQDIFPELLENLYHLESAKASLIAEAIVSSDQADLLMKESLIDVTGRAGERRDLPMMMKLLAEEQPPSIRLHAASAIASILKNSTDKPNQ